MTPEAKVINKFLVWYESLTPAERRIFEGEMGRLMWIMARDRND